MPNFRDDIAPAFEDVHDFHEHIYDELGPDNFMEEPVGSKDLLPPMVRLVSNDLLSSTSERGSCQKSACLYCSPLLASILIIALICGLEIPRESIAPGEC